MNEQPQLYQVDLVRGRFQYQIYSDEDRIFINVFCVEIFSHWTTAAFQLLFFMSYCFVILFQHWRLHQRDGPMAALCSQRWSLHNAQPAHAKYELHCDHCNVVCNWNRVIIVVHAMEVPFNTNNTARMTNCGCIDTYNLCLLQHLWASLKSTDGKREIPKPFRQQHGWNGMTFQSWKM